MGAKTQALKNAARKRMEETGQSYEAALRDARAEYEQRSLSGDNNETFGDHDASPDPSIRPISPLTAVRMAWAIGHLGGEDTGKQFATFAADTELPGADPLHCHLCDAPIDLARERQVDVGLVLREVQQGGRLTELQMPVWTHERCASEPRVWSWGELTEARHRAGLRVDPADRPPRVRRRGTADWALFSIAGNGLPLLYLQPGDPHTYGDLAWRADMLTVGLPEADLRGTPGFADLPQWTLDSEGQEDH